MQRGNGLSGWDERKRIFSGGALDELDDANAAFQPGRALALDDAVAIALGELEPPQDVP